MDKNTLISGPGEETEEIDLGRIKVVVKSVTRTEMIKIGEAKGLLDRERKLISWGMVDPELTYQDVEAWQNQPSSAGEIEQVTRAIARMSGMLEGAKKETFQEAPDGSES